jgi:hypothetical protein
MRLLVSHNPEHIVYLLRVQIKISIKKDHVISGNMRKTLPEGVTFAVVRLRSDGHNGAEIPRSALGFRKGIIVTAIVNQEYFKLALGPAEDLMRLSQIFVYMMTFIEGWHQDRNFTFKQLQTDLLSRNLPTTTDK